MLPPVKNRKRILEASVIQMELETDDFAHAKSYLRQIIIKCRYTIILLTNMKINISRQTSTHENVKIFPFHNPSLQEFAQSKVC